MSEPQAQQQACKVHKQWSNVSRQSNVDIGIILVKAGSQSQMSSDHLKPIPDRDRAEDSNNNSRDEGRDDQAL